MYINYAPTTTTTIIITTTITTTTITTTTGIYAGVCVRQIDQYSSGVCLLLGVGLTGLPQGVPTGWVLQAGAMRMARSAGEILASGSWSLGKDDLTVYHNLSLAVQGSEYTAVVDGKVR